MADIMTMREMNGDLKGKQVTFVGDGNNVARSLLHACAMAGVHLNCSGLMNIELSKAGSIESSKIAARLKSSKRSISNQL